MCSTDDSVDITQYYYERINLDGWGLGHIYVYNGAYEILRMQIIKMRHPEQILYSFSKFILYRIHLREFYFDNFWFLQPKAQSCFGRHFHKYYKISANK